LKLLALSLALLAATAAAACNGGPGGFPSGTGIRLTLEPGTGMNQAASFEIDISSGAEADTTMLDNPGGTLPVVVDLHLTALDGVAANGQTLTVEVQATALDPSGQGLATNSDQVDVTVGQYSELTLVLTEQ
jgi:hypothetical protein